MDFKRGQIVRINLEPTQGSEQKGVARPCVILSITPLNQKLRHIGVVPCPPLAKAPPPVVVSMPFAGTASVALCHHLRTINKVRVGKYVGDLSPADMTAVESAVRQVHGL